MTTIYYDAKDAIPNGYEFKPLDRYPQEDATILMMLPWNVHPPGELRALEKALDQHWFLVGCLIEPRGNTNTTHIYDPQYLAPLDMILTFDKELLETPGLNTKLWPCAGAFVSPRNCETWNVPVKEKTKLVSTLISDKTSFEGHKLRHELIPDLERLGVDIYGAAVGRPVDRKEEAMDDYMFHIVIENSRADYYWSEKLVDSYLRGCVPIYWGCPSIHDCFSGRPLLTWETRQGLFAWLDAIHASGNTLYEAHKQAVGDAAKMILDNHYDSYGPRILAAITEEAG